MSSPDENYFSWLVRRVEQEPNTLDPSRTYGCLFSALHQQPFMSMIDGDENRRDDGIYLRSLYVDYTGTELPFAERRRQCSFLEMLIAFAERMFYLAPEELGYSSELDVFWSFLENMNLVDLTDEAYLDDPEGSQRFVENACHAVNDQWYAPNGAGGGIIVVNDPRGYDFTKIELWDQAHIYMMAVYEDADTWD